MFGCASLENAQEAVDQMEDRSKDKQQKEEEPEYPKEVIKFCSLYMSDTVVA